MLSVDLQCIDKDDVTFDANRNLIYSTVLWILYNLRFSVHLNIKLCRALYNSSSTSNRILLFKINQKFQETLCIYIMLIWLMLMNDIDASIEWGRRISLLNRVFTCTNTSNSFSLSVLSERNNQGVQQCLSTLIIYLLPLET